MFQSVIQADGECVEAYTDLGDFSVDVAEVMIGDEQGILLKLAIDCYTKGFEVESAKGGGGEGEIAGSLGDLYERVGNVQLAGIWHGSSGRV